MNFFLMTTFVMTMAFLDGGPLFLSADAAQRTGNFDVAYQQFIQCSSESEIVKPYALSRAAQNLALAGNYEQAETLFEQVLKNYPNGPWVRLTHYRLGKLYLQMGQQDKACYYFHNVFSELQPIPWFLTNDAAIWASLATQSSLYATEGFAFFRHVAQNTLQNSERKNAAKWLLTSPNAEDRIWGIYALVRSDEVKAARDALTLEAPLLLGLENKQISLAVLDTFLPSEKNASQFDLNSLKSILRINEGSMYARVWLMLTVREQALAKCETVAEALASLLLDYFSEGRDAGDACWWLAERYERNANIQGANRMYRLLATRASSHVRAPRSLFNLANRARSDGQTAEAFALYETLGTTFPKGQFTAEGYYRCAQLAAQQRNSDRERHYLALAAQQGLGHFYAHRAAYQLHKKYTITLENPRKLRIVGIDDFLQAFPVPERTKPPLIWVITDLPAYDRVKFFGMYGLEEGEWETLGCLVDSPSSLHKLWYLVAAESGFMHTANQFATTRGWGIENGQPTLERHHLSYPLAYWPTVSTTAQQLGIDPYLLLAIARQESTFRASVISHAGATGVLQLMPDTARWLAQKDSRISTEHITNLNSPVNSILLGAVYLNRMLSRSDNNVIYALAAYNAGPGNCDKWRSRFVGYNPEAFVEAIPFSETNDYVKKVLANYAAYHSLYPPPDVVKPYTAVH